MRKKVFWNTLGTGFNAFLSLFFFIIAIRVNGLDEAGIFTFSFSMACLLYIVGTYSGRIYQVTDITDLTDNDYITTRIITCLLMIVLSILFVIFNRYNIHKSAIFIALTLYKAIEAFSDVLYGIMQKNEKIDKVGKSYFIKSLVSVLVFLIVDFITKNIFISCISIIIATVLLTIFYDTNIVKKLIEIKNKVDKNNIKRLLKSGFVVFIITFISVFVVNIPKYAIDRNLSDNIQAIFGIIMMPATVISLFSQFVIHPILTNITKLCEEKNYNELRKLMHKIMVIILAIGLACSLIAYIIGIPVLELIYNVNLKNYRFDLVIILFAATVSATSGIISPFLIALRYNWIQFFVGISLIVVESILCFLLVNQYGITGVCIAYLISMIYNCIVFYIVSYNKINKKIKGVN